MFDCRILLQIKNPASKIKNRLKDVNLSTKNVGMILPIVADGDPVLKKEAEEIDEKYPDLFSFHGRLARRRRHGSLRHHLPLDWSSGAFP